MSQRGRGHLATIDLTELEKLCSLQCTDEEIAAWFGTTTKTLQRRRKRDKQFAEIMDNARQKGKVSVRRNLFKLANDGNVGAAIFLAKNLLGYRDQVEHAHLGPENGPVRIVVEYASEWPPPSNTKSG